VVKAVWSKFKPSKPPLAPSTKHRIAVAVATANRGRKTKPVTLAATPWELTKEKK